VTRVLSRPIAAGVALAALAGAITIQSARDAWYPRSESERTRVLYVQSPALMKRLALGFEALLADIYWIRAIQHYGGDRLDTGQTAGRKYELLYPLLDIATSLDPHFNIAYRFGAIFLGEPHPGGPDRPDLSIALLRKAIAAMPTKWQYYHDIAFVYYWRLHDYKAAGEWFERAAAQPGAPNWLPAMAASMVTRSTDRATARFMWRQLAASEQAWVRRTAERSLLQLDALDQIDQLQATVARMGAVPPGGYSWSALVRAGLLRGVPVDPTGTPYEIDATTGAIRVSAASLLSPMPDKTGHPQ
jgi:tetratricopeptide (TPR) repeat protein